MVVGYVGRQLALYHTFDKFGHCKDYGNRAVVKNDGLISGLENWMNTSKNRKNRMW